MKNLDDLQFDVLIVGTGAAGLGVALSLSKHTRIALISKDTLSTGASPRAQGGIAAVMEKSSDIEAHISDTMIAGAGLCEPDAVRFTVENAKTAIEWLIEQGVEFTKTPDNQSFHLNQEGGHSTRRILHAADRTGDAVIKSLAQQVIEKENITCFTQHTAIDLIIEKKHCIGATVLNNKTNQVIAFYAKKTVLATGGASSVYLHSSNPDACTGDGIAMAFRAGCTIANMEFNQFHPTCLYHEKDKNFLISEAVRGEGGYLKLPNGKRFMPDYDIRAELSPRDIVARAIDSEMKKHQLKHVLLDITHLPANEIHAHFPTISKRCLSLGLDITTQPIPVTPAAHYTCGGIKTNLQGETEITGLFAVGETAYTGLHGANRMASNSLLECVVFAASCAQQIQKNLEKTTRFTHKKLIQNNKTIANPLEIAALTKQIQSLMWQQAGIVRSDAGLKQAESELQIINKQLNSLWQNHAPSKLLIEARNLCESAALIIQSALARKESRGLHFNTDHPQTDCQSAPTVCVI